VDWLSDRAKDVAGMSAGAWTAVAAWLAVVVGIAALVYAWRQYQRARDDAAELMQPNVAMFMEPSASDWHLVELVVKNFGRTAAYGIRFEFANPPTVGKYESAYEDEYVDIAELNLPAEIPYLAPTQEWRIVWDSALDRRELGEAIGSRFHGALTYYDEPKPDGNRDSRNEFRSTAVLDWGTLHPVERLQLLTTHDLARQEKQKLELLRNLLTYYHYAANESREEVLRTEINRVRKAADDLRDRYRAQYNNAALQGSTAPRNNTVEHQVPQNGPPNVAVDNDVAARDEDVAFQEAHTTIINGRHHRPLR
jgi:hypothetical protein